MEKIKLKGKALCANAILALILICGCGNSENFVFIGETGGTVTPPAPAVMDDVVQSLDPPVAASDTFDALGNATVNQEAPGVLANDTLNQAEITDFDAMGSQGGAIVLNADGSFSYSPPLDYVGPETFDYTLSNETGTSTATVTMTSTGRGVFVDNSVTAGGGGTQSGPFNSLADAVAEAQAGDTIFVARGTGDNTGMSAGATLPVGVNLVGEGTGLILRQTVVPVGQNPVITGPVVCQGDNVVRGFTIDGSIDAVSIKGVGRVTVSDNTFVNSRRHIIVEGHEGGPITIQGNIFNDPPSSSDFYIQALLNDDTLIVDDNDFLTTDSGPVKGVCEVEGGGNAVSVSFSNNRALGTQTARFSKGLEFFGVGATDCTVSVSGNELSGFNVDAVSSISQGNGNLDVDATGNTLSDCRNGISTRYRTAATLVFTGNTITNTDNGISVISATDNASAVLFAQGNIVSASANRSFLFSAEQQGSSLCCDLFENTVEDMSFNSSSNSNIDVEQLFGAQGGPIDTVNTFTDGAFDAGSDINELGGGTVTSVVDGTCSL